MAKEKKIISGTEAVTGKVDQNKARLARMASGMRGYNRSRMAGMMLDGAYSFDVPYQSGYRMDSYRTSFAFGLGQPSGTYDVPKYFVMMNEQNGGMLYWPVTLQERYSWFRYWARCFTNPDVLITRADGTEAPLRYFKTGDKVQNRLGGVTEVKEVTVQRYKGDVVCLQVYDNRQKDIEVTPEHPFFVLRSVHVSPQETGLKIDYQPEWVDAKDIREGDFLISPAACSDKVQQCGECYYEGNALLPVRSVSVRSYDGVIWNLSTCGESYDERTFLVYGVATHNTDPYIGRGLDLMSDLPMSKLTLNMPKMDKRKRELRDEIMDFFRWQMEQLNMFELCQSILRELFMLGNVYIFIEWDDNKKAWSRAVMLPPEEVYVFQIPFSDQKRIEYKPQRLIQIIKSSILQDGTEAPPEMAGHDEQIRRQIVESVPPELVEQVRENGAIVLDSDPMTGSFVAHIARRKAPYEDLGSSVLERVLVPMLEKEHLRYTQLSLASRNMTPKQLITAPGLLPSELEDLRTQVDLSYQDPDYAIVTNYEVNWQELNARDRLLELSSEYERLDNQIFAALGVTRELMTGETQYSGGKITLDILNTMFILSREVLKSFIEKQLFVPICAKRGWYEDGKNDIRTYWYPKVGFNRLTIRDNAEVFDSLFQLYQKGSLPVDVIYELFNLDNEEMTERLCSDMFTVKDPTFNRLQEEVNSDVGRAMVDKTDIVERVAAYLGIKVKQEGVTGLGGEEPMGFRKPDILPGQPPLVVPEDAEWHEDIQEDNVNVSKSLGKNLDDIANKAAVKLRPGASDDEISRAVDEVDSSSELSEEEGPSNA